jgi:hypothetical protein
MMSMRDDSDSSEREPGDYLLVAIAFGSFVLAGGGVILSSPLLASAGATILLLALACLVPRRPPEGG